MRDADTRFVLDELTAIEDGANPDAEQRPLPKGLRGCAWTCRGSGCSGMSIGGATAAATMLDDPRIKAGIDMDGTLYGPVVTAGLNRPFLLLSSQDHSRDNDPTWASFWDEPRPVGSSTSGCSGSAARLLSSTARCCTRRWRRLLDMPPDQLAQIIGTVDPERAMAATAAYVDSFFDHQLRHHDDHLMDGPSPRFPEMQFVP